MKGGHVARQLSAKAEQAEIDNATDFEARQMEGTARPKASRKRVRKIPVEAPNWTPEYNVPPKEPAPMVVNNYGSSVGNSNTFDNWVDRLIAKHLPTSLSIITQLQVGNNTVRKELFLTFPDSNEPVGIGGNLSSGPVSNSQS